MIEINPREIAAQAIMEIMEEGAYNNVVLRRILRQNGAMSQKDRSLVTEMVNGTLRNLYYIDHGLNQFSKTRTEKMKPWILAILRTALYQMLFMNIPDSAACNEAVKLAELRGLSPLKGFVNGVLRTAGREKENISLPPKGTAEYISIRYSHPLWLVRMWIAYYGIEEAEALCAAGNTPPDVTLRVNTLKIETQALKKQLEEAGITVSDGRYCKDALHVKGTADLGKLAGYTKGLFHVQDESSQLAIALLDPQKGETVLDICAAPGGKSFTMGEKMENVGKVVSCDIYEHKVELIAQGRERLGISCILPCLQDATVFEENMADGFDRVLVDAPCSGLGLMAKKPDIRLKKTGNEIDTLIPLQRQILENAARYVKKGGVLLYSTCTLSKKENEKNVEWFLAGHPEFSGEDISAALPSQWESSTAKQGYVTILPHRSKTDGFFIARLKRKE